MNGQKSCNLLYRAFSIQKFPKIYRNDKTINKSDIVGLH